MGKIGRLVCHEGLQTHKMVTCEVSESATFKEMVVWPTVFDMQVLITNHFVLLRGKPIGGERHMKVFCKEGKVSDKEMNGSESLMKHRYHIRLIKTRMLSKFWDYNWGNLPTASWVSGVEMT